MIEMAENILDGRVHHRINIYRVAFIQPTEYRSAEVVSDGEAYFTQMKAAQRWLQSSRKP